MAATVESLTVAIDDQASAASDQMAASMQGAADAADKLAGSVETTDATITRSTRSWQSWAASGVDPAATSAKKAEAAQRAAQAATDALTVALQKGQISATQFAQGQQDIAATLAQRNSVVQAAQDRTEKLRGSSDSLTTSTSAQSAAFRQLEIQASQAISGIATGQGVFTVLIQQGHQVFDVLESQNVGFSALGSAAKNALAAIGGLPVLIGGSLVAALGLLTDASNNSLGQFAALKVALQGAHSDYAVLAQGVEDAAKRVSASSGLGFTEALTAAKAIAQGRYFSGTSADIEQLTRDAADLGAVMGTSATEAAKTLAQAIEDPSKAATSLSATLSTTLTPELLRQIDLSQRAGNQSQAFSLLLGGIESASKGAARDGLSPLAKAWQDLGNAFSDSTKGWAPFMSYLSTTAASVIEAIAASVKGLSDAFHSLKGAMTVGPVIDANTGKTPTGITLPNGASNDIYRVAEANNIPPWVADLQTRIAKVESGGQQFNANGSVVTSPAGALGMMQIMPATAAGKTINPTGDLDPTKLDDNILLSARLLVELGQTFHGDEQQIVAAYNSSPDRVNQAVIGKTMPDGSKVIVPLPDETQKYVKNVTGSAFSASGSTGGAAGSAASMVNDNKALADSFETLTKSTQQIKADDLQAQLDKIHLSMDQVAASAGKNSDQYIALQQAESGVIAQQHANVDAMTAAQRASASALAANQGLTDGERALSAAIEARHQVALNAGLPFGDAEQQQATLEFLAKQSQAANQLAASLQLTVGQNQDLAGAYLQGDQAAADATAKQQAYNEAIKLFPGSAAQQGQAIAALIPLYHNLATSAAEVQIAQKTLANDNQLTYIDAETKSIGLNDNARTAYLAHLQAEQLLVSKNISLTSDQGAAYLASVDKISAASAALKAQEASLSELTGFFDNTFSTISDAIVSAFATGSQSAVKFQDVVGSVVKAIEAEFIKLALVNPLKDLFLGTTSPSLSSVGGILGKLLGNDGGTTVVGAAGITGAAGLVSAFDGEGTTASGSGSSFNDPISLGTVATGAKLVDQVLGGSSGSSTGGGLLAGLADKITNAVTSALGNASSATNIALSGAGEGVYGVASTSEVAAASIANSLGVSDSLASTISSAASTVVSALPYIGTAITLVTDIANGNYRGAGLVATGAIVGSFFGPVGTAVGAAVGGLIDAFLPSHPLHPYSNVDLNIQGGKLTTDNGYDVGQLTNLNSDKAGVQAYADSINTYLQKVGVVITDADGTLGHIGAGITGFNRAGLTTGQTTDPSTLFKNLSFGDDPNDTSNFGVAKGALTGMSFNSPIDLQTELYKIAGFADAVDALGINLASVGKDISNIQIASVTGANPGGTSTVTNASGEQVTFLSDLRTALNADLPGKSFADTSALDAELQKVSDFVTGTLPSLLTPVRATQSTLQDQIQASNQKYADAAAQSRSYGLNNDAALAQGRDEAITILMKPATDALNTLYSSIAGRGQTLLSGQYSTAAGQATLSNLAQTQNNERSSLYDTIHQTYGDNQNATDAYNNALQALLVTQNAETQATLLQATTTRDQSISTLASLQASYAQRAGLNDEAAALAAQDAKAAVERDQFYAAWIDTYGQLSTATQAFQDQLVIVDAAHAADRLAIEQNYATQSNAALKQAQGSVTTLFGSIKDYALKLQTDSQSTLSPLSQYDVAKSQFNAVSGAAAAGDATSAQQLTTYADALLSASQAVNGSGANYANDYSQVLDALQSVTASSDTLTQSFITLNTQTQTDTLATAIAGVQNEVAALRREMAQQTRAMAIAS